MINKLLLIDDSEGEALLVRQQLKAAGFGEPILWLKSAEEAMDYLSSEKAPEDREQRPLPDVILLDLGMPDIDGYQFLSWLRRHPECGRTFVVVLTGEMDPKRIKLAYQLGANSFLAKSGGVEEFANFVQFLRSFAQIANALPKDFAGHSTLPSITRVPDQRVSENDNAQAASRG